jgi:uncharacterized membrane protein
MALFRSGARRSGRNRYFASLPGRQPPRHQREPPPERTASVIVGDQHKSRAEIARFAPDATLCVPAEGFGIAPQQTYNGRQFKHIAGERMSMRLASIGRCAAKLLALLVLTGTGIGEASAQPILSAQEITRGVVKVATAYADAISCGHPKISAKNIAALVPYKADARDDARYLVVWSGDIGCEGGTGSVNPAISTVNIGAGNRFFVDPLRSSPSIKHEIPVRYVERLVGTTADSLTVEGKAYGPNDGNCCPSTDVRATVKVDAKGNWKIIDRKIISPKK